jgi:hypothetical protein
VPLKCALYTIPQWLREGERQASRCGFSDGGQVQIVCFPFRVRLGEGQSYGRVPNQGARCDTYVAVRFARRTPSVVSAEPTLDLRKTDALVKAASNAKHRDAAVRWRHSTMALVEGQRYVATSVLER